MTHTHTQILEESTTLIEYQVHVELVLTHLLELFKMKLNQRDNNEPHTNHPQHLPNIIS